MSQLRLWAFSLCAAATVSALLQMLLPPKTQNRAVGMVINLFLLLCVVSPLSHIWTNHDFDGWEPSSPAPQIGLEAADDIISHEIEARLDGLIREKLLALGIIPAGVRIDIIVSEDSFAIEGITVLLSPTDQAASGGTAAARLTEELGLPVTVRGVKEVT